MDSLLAMVQMPGGVPVAVVAIGSAGAKNAALLAVQMLGIKHVGMKEAYAAYRKKLAQGS
jgi:5-(carboxyamino)imidazole ribonucleotide mutase